MEELDIKELIVKFIRGELNERGHKDLNEWLVNKEHQALFDKICDKDNILSKARLFDRHHPDKVWKRIDQRISAPKKVSRWYRYASAIMLPFVFGLLLYGIWEISKNKDTGIVQSIEAGQNGAIIKLANGHVLNSGQIENNLSLEGISLENKDGMLSYRVEDKKLLRANDIRHNEIITPRGCEYSVVLPDSTRVWLNAESYLRFPLAFSGKERKVYVKGELFFEVTPDKKRPFIVVSGESTIKVLGTKFNVRTYPDAPYTATLVSGKIGLEFNGQEVLLKPGQQAMYNKSTRVFDISEVDVTPYIAWKNGYFLFDNMTLGNIMKELARWYDVEVFFENQSVLNERFSVELKRHDNFEEILELIECTGMVKLEVRDRTVIVR